MIRIALLMSMLAAMPAQAQTVVRLHAAGSLRGALTDIATAYQQATGNKVEATFGASGLLRDRIAAGEPADLFASANMEHPRSLATAGKSGPVAMFARNRLCALVRTGVAAEPATLLARMLDPAIKLGSSTPKADPSGDYAWEVFRKADALKPGAFAALSAKARQLTGGPDSPAPPPNRNVYGALVADGAADIFLTYCTNAVVAVAENPGQRIVALSEPLAVGADYGLTVMTGASPAAQSLADFILSPAGQTILARHGFAAPKGE